MTDKDLLASYFKIKKELYNQLEIYDEYQIHDFTDCHWVHGGNVIFWGYDEDVDENGPYANDITEFVTRPTLLIALCRDDGCGSDPFYMVFDRYKEIQEVA